MGAAYERAHFGGAEPTDGRLVACWRLYDGFAVCAEKRVRRLKYWFGIFWAVWQGRATDGTGTRDTGRHDRRST